MVKMCDIWLRTNLLLHVGIALLWPRRGGGGSYSNHFVRTAMISLTGTTLWSHLLQNGSADVSLPDTNQIWEECRCEHVLHDLDLEHSMTPIAGCEILEYL